MSRVRRQQAASPTMLALTLPVVLAVAVLAVDLARMRAFKRDMQDAAGAAATEAAQRCRPVDCASSEGAARGRAPLDGFPASDGALVEVRVPPRQGLRAGDSSFLEVVVRKEAPMYFTRVLRSEPAMVECRAVTGLVPDVTLGAAPARTLASFTLAE